MFVFFQRQLSEVIKINPSIDKSSRETNFDRRKARQTEQNNKLVRSVSLDAGHMGTSSSSKKIKLSDTYEEVILRFMYDIILYCFVNFTFC